VSGPQTRSPAPRANAGNRAEVIRNDSSLITTYAEAEGDFAALFVTRHHGLTLSHARAIVALASQGRAFG
jgi:hypothetical protein